MLQTTACRIIQNPTAKKESMNLVKFPGIDLHCWLYFTCDALIANDLLQQITEVDDLVLYLQVRNHICQKCITGNRCYKDPYLNP